MSLVKTVNSCVHYLQWDSKWKSIKYSTHTSKQTIGNSGCGPTAVAMIVATFCDPTITPVEMCKWSVNNGYRSYDNGTDWGLFNWVFKHFAFARYKTTTDINVIKNALAEGALAVGSMNSNDGNFWTTQGHFITIVGYDSDGYIYAADPNKAECPRKQQQDKFKKCLKKAFIFWPDSASYDPDTLRRGSKGEKVKTMQQLLLTWDAKCLPKYGADSDFGSETHDALVKFQKAIGLEGTGVYDKATRDALTGWTPTPTPEPTPEPVTGYREATTTAEPKLIWDFSMQEIGNPFGVAAMMGNMRAESALRSMNLQNTYETKLGMTDTTYTKAVDNGSYGNFAGDSAGYGVCQWTSAGRKANLLKYAKATNSSIGNLTMQLEFLMQELRGNYKTTLTALQTAKSVREASDVVLTKFERPANQSESVKVKRASYGEEYYKTYATGSAPETPATETALRKGSKGEAVEQLQRYLIEAGYILPKYGVDGDYGTETEKAVKAFQLDNGLPGSGVYDDKTRDVLMTRVGVRVVVVLGGTVNTRTSPVNGTIYKVVRKGDKLPYVQTDANTGWYLVMVDGVAVWITPKPEYTKIAQA